MAPYNFWKSTSVHNPSVFSSSHVMSFQTWYPFGQCPLDGDSHFGFPGGNARTDTPLPQGGHAPRLSHVGLPPPSLMVLLMQLEVEFLFYS